METFQREIVKINAEEITPKSPPIPIDQATLNVHLPTTKKTKIEVIKKKNRDAQIHKARLEKAETYAEVNKLRE